MTTIRMPTRRARRSRISPTAALLFQDMRNLECTCPDDFEPGVSERCPACTRWDDVNSLLHTLLMLPPWRWPAVEAPDDPNADPDGLALYLRLAQEAQSDAITLTDAQMHHLADVITGAGTRPVIERVRAIEVVILNACKPLDDVAFGDLLTAALGRRHQAEVVPL
jgi:hypothetical protein